MTWQDRLKQAAYTPPSGTRLPFQYEDVSNKIKLRTKAFEFPDAAGTYVQQLGEGGRRFPLRVYFSGDDHDLEADTFDRALREIGVGQLEHPLYGTVDVVPFGEFTRKDSLKTAANQSVFEVVFWATTGLAYPTASTEPAGQVLAAVAEYNEAHAVEFEAAVAVQTASERARFKQTYGERLASVSDPGPKGLARIAATTAEVEEQFDTVLQSIELGIDVLIADPLSLAFQTDILIQAPARAAAAIGDRLSAYGNLAATIFGGGAGSDEQEFVTNDLYAMAYLAAPVLAVVNNTFSTRSEALLAAEEILELMQDLIVWRDANLDALDLVDPGAAYQQLQEAVAIAAGYLVEISFTLKQERILTVDAPRTAIDLAAELYGDVDGQLDFLISSNNLTGSEILEIPRGREIVYYV